MKLTAYHEDFCFMIEEDLPEIGWYLFVYNQNQSCLFDYLQNSQELAKEFAQQEFGVPLSAWNLLEH
ncbi:hypothetical protein [Hymenobacter swuensis]|uniref:Uncharacterized protein n=1 Tax=Hymenobacter swuensis DY53 TaxID=1227739 RepID=W8EUB2_9BACT|nr:hypothetical protein [Hymenobacter swuensis]AHJ96769.1 hypothetical protein Hsw_1174 [Hymenobacter swuensis DY53]